MVSRVGSTGSGEVGCGGFMRFSLSMGPLNEEVLLLLACHIDAHGMRFVLVQGKVRGRFQGKWLSFTLFSDPGKTPGKMALIQSATVVGQDVLNIIQVELP
jgi:hypothetical protein